MEKDYSAKKSLGQNFLKSEKALNSIISAANLSADDFVLEIGPGKGALTSRLLATGCTVLAIEKDSRMCEFLNEELSEHVGKKLFLSNADILEINLEKDEFFQKISGLKKINVGVQKIASKKYKLIANIPYYITGAIIRKFLSEEIQPEKMVLLVQKEVADRIVARDKKESLLSISVKAYCQPFYVETVKAGSFVPAPSVDSAIILFENISKKNFGAGDIDKIGGNDRSVNENLFFKVLNAGFAHKRKMLLSNLKEWQKNQQNLDNEASKNKGVKSKNIDSFIFAVDFEKIFEELKLNKKIRAEDLTIGEWFRIVGNLQ